MTCLVLHRPCIRQIAGRAAAMRVKVGEGWIGAMVSVCAMTAGGVGAGFGLGSGVGLGVGNGWVWAV